METRDGEVGFRNLWTNRPAPDRHRVSKYDYRRGSTTPYGFVGPPVEWLLNRIESVAKDSGVVCLASATASAAWTPYGFVEPPVEWLVKRVTSISKDYGAICLASATTSVACVNSAMYLRV